MKRTSGQRALPLVLALPLLAVCLGGVSGAAQGGANEGEPRSAGGPLEGALFPPELIMRHQARIGLGKEQRDQLVRALQQAQSELVPLQLDAAEVEEALRMLLEQSRVDEERALSLAQRLMAIEAEVRTRHLSMLIRVKNLLSAEQQQRLRAMPRNGGR